MNQIMNTFLQKARPIALFMAINLVGLYAGMHFFILMNPSVLGIKNLTGELMTPQQWAATWQLTDGFMRERMSVFGPIVLVLFILTLFLFISAWRSIAFWLILVAFGVLIADVVLTATYQFPINDYVHSIDTNHLNSAQIQKLATMHDQQLQNFRNREFFSLLSFLLISLAPFTLNRLSKN